MEFIEVLKIILIGIVEGITEWLPISSTGHMILFDAFVNMDMTEEFKNIFLVVIQLGAIMAVIVLFWKKLWPFTAKSNDGENVIYGFVKKDTMTLWAKVVIATLPAVVIGLPFDDFLEEHLMNPTTVAITLIIYGIAFILIETRNKDKHTKEITNLGELSYKTAFFIGLFQVLAMIPGTSRSGSTILGAMLIGTSRSVASEFSFFLAIPVMFGASLLKLVKYFMDGFTFTGVEVFSLLLGMVVSFIVSIFSIRFLMNFIKNHDFKSFGIYRIIVGIIIFICLAFGVL